MMMVFFPQQSMSLSYHDVDEAIKKGKAYYIQNHVRNVWQYVKNGGYIKIRDPKTGKNQNLGPNVYIECQVYDLTHFLQHHEKLGIPKNDPLVTEIFQWFYKQYNAQIGYWPLWSAEGCLHFYGMKILNRFDHPKDAKKSFDWLQTSKLYLNPGWGGGSSGYLVQSWGDSKYSLTNRFYYSDYYMFNTEHTVKCLLSLSEMGYTIKDPLIKKHMDLVYEWLKTVYSTHKMTTSYFDEMIAISFVPELYEKYKIKDTAMIKHAYSHLNSILTIIKTLKGYPSPDDSTYLAGQLLIFYERARRHIDIPKDLSQKIAVDLIAKQKPDGRWALPPFSQPKGLFISNLDGTGTLSAIFGLMEWLENNKPKK